VTRRMRLLRGIGIGLGVAIVVIAVAGINVVRSNWFREFVREKIITATANGTGGRVEVGAFQFDLAHFQADVSDLVIHGSEPPELAPYVRVKHIRLNVRLFTSIHHLLDLAYLSVERPEVNIVVFPDGTTNVPRPKTPSTSNKSALETVVDLAVDRFDLSDGVVTFASRKQPLNIRGSNLKAQLTYSVLGQSYSGQLTFDPIYIASGRNTPVNVTVDLPVSFGRDRIEFHAARISTGRSVLNIDGSLENLKNPKITAHVKGDVALLDLKNAGNLPFEITAGVPSTVSIDANAATAGDVIQVASLSLALGRTSLHASGTLKDPRNRSTLRFNGQVDLAEASRMINTMTRAEGTVFLDGNAQLDEDNKYKVTGDVRGANVAVRQGTKRYGTFQFSSAIYADPQKIDLNSLHVAAFGGDLNGNATLENMARYNFKGALQRFDIETLLAALGQKPLLYTGTLGGKVAVAGNFKSPGTRDLQGQVNLSIAPGRGGIPVSGQINAKYDGSADDIQVMNSSLALPHSQLSLNGSAKQQLNLTLVSRDLNDFLAATGSASNPHITFQGGQFAFNGTLTGSLSMPRLQGHVAADRFTVEGRAFQSLQLDATAASNSAAVRNGKITGLGLQADFSAAAGLRNWQPLPDQTVVADASITKGDLADIIALAGSNPTGYSGQLLANLHVRGTIGNPQGDATLQINNGTVEGETFDRLDGQVALRDQSVTVQNTSLQAGAGRINLTAEFHHPRDSFSTGQLHATVQSTDVDLGRLHAVQKQRPNTSGTAKLNADVNGNLTQTQGKHEFILTSVTAAASVRGFRSEGQSYGDLDLNARTTNQQVDYTLVSNFAGADIRITGNTRLSAEYPTSADANVRNLPVERILVLARRTDLPIRGTLAINGHFEGTKANPQGNLNLDLTRAVMYQEPIDRLHVRAAYLPDRVDISDLRADSGPSRVALTARYEHPVGNLQSGKVTFQIPDGRIDVQRIRNVQMQRPGLRGIVELTGNGTAEIRNAQPRIQIQTVEANLKADNLAMGNQELGNLALVAKTNAGRVNFTLDSTLAGAMLRGMGSAGLSAGYPIDAQLTFRDLTWSRLQPLVSSTTSVPQQVEGVIDGQITARGPVMNPNQLTGSAQITRLEVSTRPQKPGASAITLLQNQGPLVMTVDRGVARVQSFHLNGPSTDLQMTGNVPLRTQARGDAFSLKLGGKVNLAVFQQFSQDVHSSGSLTLDAAVGGTLNKPLMSGKLDLQNASVNYAAWPNGISNANGTIQFSGNSAVLRNVTGESGGGKITLNGFANRAGVFRFGLRAGASKVRVRVQQGVSVVVDSQVTLSGTTDNSILSGSATITQINYAPQTDFASILTRAAPPIQTTSTPSPVLDHMKLDVRVQTTSATLVQSALAENFQVNTDITARGTMSRPSVLGRVDINRGELVFFGSKYTVQSGSIGFYNPVRIEPMLDLSLNTQAKGVNLTLRVTGPVDNMKLSYTSDPPLRFEEIVGLLATGTTPTSDPTLLANQPSQPQQNFQQMGESAILSKALADPVANRLQRVFGVSQLKIDPSFTNGSQLPQAQFTLQQQIASNLTFTYVTQLDDANSTTVQAELVLTPQWSATALRDQNGLFSINLLYKRQVR
jgi:translocation and assembly module TamB